MVKKARTDKRQTTKDSGIADVAAPMSTGEIKHFKMREEIRDMLNKRNYKEPPKNKNFDPNRATAEELRLMGFSGFRINYLSNNVELWCLGRKGGEKPLDLVQRNPAILASLHEEVFLTTGSIVTTDINVKKEKLNG